MTQKVDSQATIIFRGRSEMVLCVLLSVLLQSWICHLPVNHSLTPIMNGDIGNFRSKIRWPKKWPYWYVINTKIHRALSNLKPTYDLQFPRMASKCPPQQLVGRSLSRAEACFRKLWGDWILSLPYSCYTFKSLSSFYKNKSNASLALCVLYYRKKVIQLYNWPLWTRN